MSASPFGQSVAAMRAAMLTRSELSNGAVAGSAGVAVVSFAAPFAAPPTVFPLVGLHEGRVVIAVATEVTATQAKLSVQRARGTLLLSSGPFETAPAGTPVQILATGR